MVGWILISLKRALFNFFHNLLIGWFSNISVVVSNHLIEESFGFIILSKSHAIVLNNIDNFCAIIVKFSLDLLLVSTQCVSKLLILGVLLNGANGPDRTSLWSNQIFEPYRKQISLINGKIFSSLLLNSFFQESDHVFKSLSLFCNSGKEYLFFHILKCKSQSNLKNNYFYGISFINIITIWTISVGLNYYNFRIFS